MNMPLKNGLECLEFIRSMVNLKDTPVIIYSTSRNNTEIKACFDNGANCYVVKPYTFEAIVKMVDTFCQKSRQIIKPSTLQEFVVAFE
jgi:CheY-like chemotaxis protein